MMKFKNISSVIVIGLIIVSVQGCRGRAEYLVDPSITPGITSTITPTPVIRTEPDQKTTEIIQIKVIPDVSYKEFFADNPYSQLSKYILQVNEPDKELYNYLFQAVVNHITSVDITSFDLTDKQIMSTAECLYEQAGLQLFYLNRIKWSQDYKIINFSYTDDKTDKIEEYQNAFYSQMNHLLYNVAPKDYKPLQRFFSVYEYITKHASYTDDMNDATTYTAGSLLVDQKAICGGFSFLADYALNFIGIPSEYISNQAHAWNIVTLGGKRYHTDFTWGAGNAYQNANYLKAVLMDDQARMEGLDSAGFGDYPIIFGYPGNNNKAPEPCNDSRYGFIQDIYDNYALDIENNWIYYSSTDGTHRVHLNATGKETITSDYGYMLRVYNGVLYYKVNEEGLYQYTPGKSPILMSSSDHEAITIEQGVLSYGDGNDNRNSYKLDLNRDVFNNNLNQQNTNHLEVYKLQKQLTFHIEIKFSGEMNTEQLPKDFIHMINEDQQLIPLHMTWNNTKDTLTIRVKEFINEEPSLTLYVSQGIADRNGQFTKKNYDLEIQLID
jgi:hypothetical protein